MLTKIYRRIIPITFRKAIYDFILKDILFFWRNLPDIFKSKFVYFFSWALPKSEITNAYRFIGKYGFTAYPNEYMLEYQNLAIEVYVDDQYLLPFVLHNNRKLFFPKSTNKKTVENTYRSLLIEQDVRSAHRYVRSYSELKNKVLLDIGSAEGIFALDTIDFVDHVYLFEYDDEWMLPLEATFAPWKNKVTIVKKFVDAVSSDSQIAIDDFLRDKTIDNLFLKMDIEGGELQAIEGSKSTLLNGTRIQLAICTYHRRGDPEAFAALTTSLGFQYEFSNGLMYWGKKLSKGIIRCKK